jgi:hypothetical protein
MEKNVAVIRIVFPRVCSVIILWTANVVKAAVDRRRVNRVKGRNLPNIISMLVMGNLLVIISMLVMAIVVEHQVIQKGNLLNIKMVKVRARDVRMAIGLENGDVIRKWNTDIMMVKAKGKVKAKVKGKAKGRVNDARVVVVALALALIRIQWIRRRIR